MIVRLHGKIVERHDNTLIIDVQGLCYEVIVPSSVINRIDDMITSNGNIQLITYHYLQVDPSRAFPTLVGFTNEVERDFFQQFIKVSGIGPRAAVKAMDKPISEIARAIDKGDIHFLKGLPGIGAQRAKEIIAKLQGKIGKFGLIQDQGAVKAPSSTQEPDWQQEALAVLLQLQYKKQEAMDMIKKALERSKDIKTTEELLNEIYKQKVKM
ncbi:MAG: Holliday junction branch migration protein RuvA [Candidatus Omnitrophota bacterium]